MEDREMDNEKCEVVISKEGQVISAWVSCEAPEDAREAAEKIYSEAEGYSVSIIEY
jgi:hypothetical protein